MILTKEMLQPGFKTKMDHPWDYDPFTVWGSKDAAANKTYYTDRLYRWDAKKHDRLLLEVFGNTNQYWDTKKPEDIERFLRLYLDKPTLKLVWIQEQCDPSSGFPVWRLNCLVEE